MSCTKENHQDKALHLAQRKRLINGRRQELQVDSALSPALPPAPAERLWWEQLAGHSQHPAAHGGCSSKPDPWQP